LDPGDKHRDDNVSSTRLVECSWRYATISGWPKP